MASPPPPRTTELPAASREAVKVIAETAADPHAASTLFATGGIGTGKSTVLEAVRASLRAAGRPVLSRPPRPDDAEDAAIVIDDAHLLDPADLDRLTDLVTDPPATVVIAAQPLAHYPALRGLATALERQNPVVPLGPLPPVELAKIAGATLATPPAPELVRLILSATAGLPFLLPPALAVADEGESAVRQAARFALIERLRALDERLLDTLLVSSLSLNLGADDVAAALQMSPEQALAAVDRARASGLIEPSHHPEFLQTVHDSVAQIVGAARHHDIELAVLRSQVELSILTPDLALRMAEHGLRDDGLAAALTELAARARRHPDHAARLYRAATDAGATALDGQLADALALTGDCATAGRLADELLASRDPGDRATAVRIAASIALHDGRAAQANDLFGWLGPTSDAVVDAAATIAALAAGDAVATRATSETPIAGPPTSTARAARSITEGLVMTLDQPYPVAVARLSQSIGADIGSSAGLTGVAPDTPAALVTLVALHGGDPVRARSVMGRTVRNAQGGGRADGATSIFVSHRHRLLLGWAHMQDGLLPAAGAAVPTTTGDLPLHRRDALWATALRTAIARRGGDSGAMQKHWYSAMEVLAEFSADLFTLMPLGELWVAAARMRQVDQLQHTLDEAFALLAGLGDPALWSVPLHWAGVHAGIVANSPDAVAPHGQALSAAASDSAFAKALATAGRTWLNVLADQVDADEVVSAARGLALFGHTWDATRLASQAALQTNDSRVSQAMLQLARDLKQSVASPEPCLDSPSENRDEAMVAPATTPRGTQLSDREREVAELLLHGMPYRDIGAQLFISAKTVEHHVARIRRRLGAESRSEMLSMLRSLLAPSR